MANTPLVTSGVVAQLQQLSPYLDAAFWAQLAAYDAAFYGALEVHPANAEVKPGYGSENPRFAFQGTVARADSTSTSAVDSAAGPTSVRGRGPTRTFAPANALEFLHMATRGYKKSEIELTAELAQNFGKGAARFMKQSVYYAMTGAIAQQSTGGQHLYDLTSLTTKTLTMPRVLYAKKLMGDRGGTAVALVAHSTPCYSLRNDIVSGSNSGGLMRVLVEGEKPVDSGIEGVVNMRLCEDDDSVTVAVTGATRYRSFLMCPGSVWVMPGTESPLLTVTPELLERNMRSKRVSIEGVFAVGVYGMDFDFGSAANPTDANLKASTYWAEAYSFDHRDVGICEIYSQAG